uniref:Uncharacterized protein n=1 Tax=Anguilla anguilla TaxID=7936 RepID=A0A0E9S4J6_ANGAN
MGSYVDIWFIHHTLSISLFVVTLLIPFTACS